jgi:diacylglycerol kinase
MAIRHGLAGVYGKQAAAKAFRRHLLVVALGLIAVFFSLGFWIGFTHSKSATVVGILGAVAFVIGFRACVPRIERWIDATARERLKHLRGARAEALVAWLLDELDDEWHVFNGLQLEPNRDLDHVVVGPSGIFCISTKSQKGLFVATPNSFTHNGAPCEFGNQALRQTMTLQDRLKALLGSEVPWVQSVLAVPFGYTEGRTTRQGKVWVVDMETLIHKLAPADGVRRLEKSQIARVVKALEMLAAGSRHVFKAAEPATR